MYRRIKWTLGLAAATLALAGSAEAQGRWNDHHDRDRYEHARRERYEQIRREQIHRNDGYVRDAYGRVYRIDSRKIPPGLAKKPGHMPPGQYKKQYRHYAPYQGADVLGQVMRRRGYEVLRVVPAGDSRYVYYRWHGGNAQRAFVSPGSDRLMFSNVPTQVLQAVMNQLY
ncbi:MAG TPA: hypothetical protein VIP11_00360 [Gemmatimonadaceae bacterium]